MTEGTSGESTDITAFLSSNYVRFSLHSPHLCHYSSQLKPTMTFSRTRTTYEHKIANGTLSQRSHTHSRETHTWVNQIVESREMGKGQRRGVLREWRSQSSGRLRLPESHCGPYCTYRSLPHTIIAVDLEHDRARPYPSHPPDTVCYYDEATSARRQPTTATRKEG